MPLIKKPTTFRDLIARDDLARTIVADEKKILELRGTRGDAEKETLARLERLETLPAATPVDPLFVALRAAFNADAGTTVGNPIGAHAGGKLEVTETDDEINFSLVMGNLQIAGITPPKVDTDGAKVFPLEDDPDGPPFVQAFYRALGKARASFPLAKLVLPILKAEGKGKVITREFAEVMRYLSDKGVTVKELQLTRRVNEALDQVQESQLNPPIEDLTIEIPDFNLKTEYQIQSKNVEAFGPLICAAMLDELKAFEVVDKLVELSQVGMLPTGLGGAGRILYEYWKQTPTRMSDSERRNFYSLTMGIPGGSVNGSANRDFNDLWIRFVSSVSNLVRQRTTDFLLRASIPGSLNQQQVRKAARDLALNLSSHGYGMVSFAARDLQLQINTMIKLLDNKEIRNAYGARDMWQVIDQVAALELGGARNSARYRTLATCGAIITKWLSQNITKFNSATSSEKVIDMADVLSADPRSSGPDATSTPTDYDLVNACELWLADTAVSEDGVKEYSQPRESPAMTSRPVQIPAIAKEILSQSLPPGLGFGVNRR